MRRREPMRKGGEGLNFANSFAEQLILRWGDQTNMLENAWTRLKGEEQSRAKQSNHGRII